MPSRGIDRLVWMALTDSGFSKKLLNGQRPTVLTTVDLTEAERQAVLAVQADSLEAFAEALCRSVPEGSYEIGT